MAPQESDILFIKGPNILPITPLLKQFLEKSLDDFPEEFLEQPKKCKVIPRRIPGEILAGTYRGIPEEIFEENTEENIRNIL